MTELPSQAPATTHLRSKIIALAVLPLLASLALIAVAVQVQTQRLARQERELVESVYAASKETESRAHLASALHMLAPLYEADLADDATRAEAALVLQSLRHSDGNGYFFAFTYDGIAIVQPMLPELVGQSMWATRDPNGVPVVQELIRTARSGGGIVRYLWDKPGTDRTAPKLAVVVDLPKWGWVIGTGVYIDELETALHDLDRQSSDNIRTTLFWIAVIALLGIALVAAAALALNLSAYRAADAQLQAMARKVVQTQEDERAHLSRELHDSTSQTLVSIKLLLDSAINQLRRDAPSAQPLLEKARSRIGEALAEVRHISHRLRPVALDTLGLPEALSRLGEEFADHAGLAFFMRVRGDRAALPEDVNTALFRIAQEALTNIDKHAEAARVDVRLIFHASGVRLTIADDGRGFDTVRVQADPQGGIGLRNMIERLASIGGRCHVHSVAGLTRVVADVPLAALRRLAPAPTPSLP